jgi:small conductance mechanosensitive channel
MPLSIDQIDSPEKIWALGIPLALKVVSALVIFLLGKWLLSGLVGLIRRLMRRGHADETLVGFVTNALTGLGLALVVVSALGQLGINTTSLSAVIGGAALAIGLALQNQLASFAAGVMLILFRPFKVGDGVKVAGIGGTIEEIKIVVTQLRTDDNDVITIPNAKIWGDSIINYSQRPIKRIDQLVSLSYEADLRKARTILEELLAKDERILKDPAAAINLLKLGDNSVDFGVRPWTTAADNWAVQCDLREAIKLRFDEAGIPFASHTPLVNVALKTSEHGAEDIVEKTRA